MLLSMIAPHLFNVVNVARIMKRTEEAGDWGGAICMGVVIALNSVLLHLFTESGRGPSAVAG